MNAPEFVHHFSPEGHLAAGTQSKGSASPAHRNDELPEFDTVKRHRQLLLSAIVILAVGFLGVFYFGATSVPPSLEKSPDRTLAALPYIELQLPHAPGLSSASRAFSPDANIQRSVGAADAVAGVLLPEESLHQVGRELSLEWELALLLSADPDMLDKSGTSASFRAPARAAPSAPATAGPVATLQLSAPGVPMPALATAKALPADAPAQGGAQSQPAMAAPGSGSAGGRRNQQFANGAEGSVQVSRVPVGEVVVQEVHPGIIQRTYGPSPEQLAQELKTCSAQGFIAGEQCRMRVCDGLWDKVPACRRSEPLILP